MSPIRIGMIGASANSWASRSHMPYFKSSRNEDLYNITALQNSSKASAEKAARTFELSSEIACYGDAESLAADKNVDVVAVSVNVPVHYQAIMPALHSGKDIFVEWPLARNLSEAKEMVAIVREKGLRTMVGLQARYNPSILAAKKLIDSGKIGRVIGTTMHGYGIIHGAKHPKNVDYGLPIEAGANLLTIPFGHAVDALCFVLGELEYVSATLAIGLPEFELVDDEKNVVGKATKTSHDFVSVQGPLVQGGGTVNAVYQGGMNPTGGPGFVWQIEGTEGVIRMEGDMGHVQMWQPRITAKLKGDTEMREVDGVKWVGTDFSYAVGEAWDAFAKERGGDSVEDGSPAVVTFEDALVRHKMIDAIYRSNEKGTRERYI